MTYATRRGLAFTWVVGATIGAGASLVGACNFAASTPPDEPPELDSSSTYDVTFSTPDADAGGPDATDATHADSASAHESGADAAHEAAPEAAAAEAGPGCSFGAACAPGQCQVGVTQCDGGTQFCQVVGDTAPGQGCGDGGVCSGTGTCNACSPGADCTDAGSCSKESIVCTSGAPVCTPAGNEPNGTPCGKDLYCTSGACASCTPGASCVPAGKPCDVGTVSCSAGFACTDTGSPTTDGTPCGANEVCKGGQCVACVSGASCNPNGNLCQRGTTSCATGAQACGALVNVADGTPCGNGEVCHAGQCAACQTGAPCTPPGNLCDKGAVSCATGIAVCVDTGAPAVTCTASDACHVAGTCDPGSGQCSNPVASPGTLCNDGDACTTGDHCTGGVCGGAPVTCTASDPCHVAGTCDPGSGQCSNPAASPGTLCDDGNACTTGDQCTGGVCGGAPVTCTASDSCHLAGTCSPGSGQCSNPIAGNGTLCSGGNGTCQGGACSCTSPLVACGSSCVDIFTDNSNCNGCGNVCPVLSNPSVGTTCTEQQVLAPKGVCVGKVGGVTGGAGANPLINASYVYAVQISFPKTVTVTELHVVVTGGALPMDGALGLYTDANGTPGTRTLWATARPLNGGDNALPLFQGATQVAAGTYWVAGIFNASVAGVQYSLQLSPGILCMAASNPYDTTMPATWPTQGRSGCTPVALYAVADF